MTQSKKMCVNYTHINHISLEVVCVMTIFYRNQYEIFLLHTGRKAPDLLDIASIFLVYNVNF
mgnify:CR=1 FL=1